MHSGALSQRLYKLTLAKYEKFKARLEKAIRTGEFERLSVKKRQLLIHRVKRLLKKIRQMSLEFKVGLSGAALALILSISDAQAQLGPFAEKPRSENPLRPPLLESYMRPAASDVDDDGDVDVLVGLPDGTVRFFRNDGTPSKPAFNWISGPENPFDGVSSGSSIALEFADLDNDGDEDLSIVDNNGFSSFWRKDGPNSFTEVTGPDDPLNGITLSMGAQFTFANVDETGDIDIVSGFAYDGGGFGEYLVMFGNNGSGFIRNDKFDGIGFSSESPLKPAFADVDNDGDLDMLLGSTVGYGYASIAFYRQNSSGDFVQEVGASNPFNGILFGNFASPTFADLDSDGDMDVIVGRNYFNGYSPHSNSLAYFENKFNETGVFQIEEKTELENPFDGILGADLEDSNREVSIDFIDIDGDAELDVVLGSKYDNDLRYYKFSSIHDTYIRQEGASNPFDGMVFGGEVTPRTVALNDPNFKDIIVGASTTNYLLENNQDGTFTRYTRFVDNLPVLDDIIANATKYAFLDVNNDGHNDIFVGTEYNGVRLYINDGAGNYEDAVDDLSIGLPPPFDDPFTLNGVRAKPYAADINHDGYTDLVLGMGDGILRAFVNVDGTYQFAELTDAANPFGAWDFGDDASPTVVDFDEDGDLDFFVGTYDGESSP